MNHDLTDLTGTEYPSMDEAVAATCERPDDLIAIEYDGRYYVREITRRDREMIASALAAESE